MLDQTLTSQLGLAAPDTSFNPDELGSMDGAGLLEQVSQFIGRYLQCSEHQRTVLALWVLHTHCLPAAQVTPYLAIQSAEKQSGKTLCLQLLNLLCDSPALTAGFTANALTRRIDGPISTILLDECPATVGTRARSKGPTLRAILASGYHCGPGYTDATHERNAFCPKAFAGMGQLPEALADRSISIILEPLVSGARPPSAVAFGFSFLFLISGFSAVLDLGQELADAFNVGFGPSAQLSAIEYMYRGSYCFSRCDVTLIVRQSSSGFLAASCV